MQPIPLREVDLTSDPRDHLGDYADGAGDPYPATREAVHRATQVMPGEVHADPDEVRNDATRYAARPWRHGTQTRQLAPGQWTAAGHILQAGAQGWRLVDADPGRARARITNYSAGDVYVAPTPTRSPGQGACIIPAATAELVHNVPIESTAEVWIFTLAGYDPGATAPVHVQVVTERYAG